MASLHFQIKPALINEQSVVYQIECGWCDASYVGYTRRYLYQRIDEHKRSGSIFNHSQSQHPSRTITFNMFHILKKCSGKFDCLLYEMFLIREHKPCLNIQSDSIKAKLFTQPLGTKNLNLNININILVIKSITLSCLIGSLTLNSQKVISLYLR